MAEANQRESGESAGRGTVTGTPTSARKEVEQNDGNFCNAGRDARGGAPGAGIDGHKMQVTVSVHLCEPGRGTPLACTATFGTDPQALPERVRWLRVHGVGAATIESLVV